MHLAKDLPGITTALNVLDKGGLKVAAARLAVDLALEKVRESITEGIKIDFPIDGWKLVDEIWSNRAARGTDGHTIGELLLIQYAHGEQLTDSFIGEMLEKNQPLASDDIYLGALAIRDWIKRVQPVVMNTEKMTVCLECGYCATLDLVCTINGEPWVIDAKWGKDVYDTYGMQVVGQIHALENTVKDWQIERREFRGAHRYTITGNGVGRPPHTVRQAMRGGILWVAPFAKRGCELIEIRTDLNELQAFYSVLAAWKWRRSNTWRLSGK